MPEANERLRSIVLALAFLLPAAPTWADTLTNHMNAVTVRVLCLPAEGEPESGSGFVVGGGSHVVTNWQSGLLSVFERWPPRIP